MSESDKKVKAIDKLKTKKSYVLIAVVIVLIVGAVGGGIGYSKYDKLQKENARLSDPQEAARAETGRLKAQVARLIEVPANESPTIATVVDASKLKNQSFFAKAENGDRVLMFPQAKRAILYRPSIDKIIEVAPINIGDGQSSQKPQAPPANTAPTTNRR